MKYFYIYFQVNARDDEDDVFVDRASEKRSDKASEREIKRAIDSHKRTEKILNSCRYCFDSEEMLKHLFIAKGEKVITYINLLEQVILYDTCINRRCTYTKICLVL